MLIEIRKPIPMGQFCMMPDCDEKATKVVGIKGHEEYYSYFCSNHAKLVFAESVLRELSRDVLPPKLEITNDNNNKKE